MHKQNTIIKITPPGGVQRTITLYDTVTVSRSTADRAGTYSIVMRNADSDLIDLFSIGSDVQITQDGHKYRGWVLNPAKALDANIRTIQLDGLDYTAKSQKIIVTEAFVSKRIDDIVDTLFSSYVPWGTRTGIEECSTVISIRFGDVFLWDAMERLCELTGYEWFIDENLNVNFFQPGERINSNVIGIGDYKRGTATLKPDSSKLVNKLWVKGGKALSDNFTQNITVSGALPIPLYYSPRATTEGVIVIVNGVQRSVGIQNLTPEGTTDFLLNFAEKLLIPDLLTSGSGTIVYRYEYPIKLLLEEPSSKAQYGDFEDILTVETTDRNLALDIGLRYLSKYSQPVMTGSIEPFAGVYSAGELVKVELPELSVDSYLQIKSVSYESRANTRVVTRRLELESPERNLTNVLKDFDRRLKNIEGAASSDEDPVERYIAIPEERYGWTESVTQAVHACPIPWAETVFVSPYLIIDVGLFPSESLYPC